MPAAIMSTFMPVAAASLVMVSSMAWLLVGQAPRPASRTMLGQPPSMAGESPAHGRSTRHAQAAGAWTRSARKARSATGWDGITRPDGRAASAAALAAQGEGRQADDGGQADGEEHEDGRQGHGSSLSFWTGPRRLPGQLRDAASRPPLPVA